MPCDNGFMAAPMTGSEHQDSIPRPSCPAAFPEPERREDTTMNTANAPMRENHTDCVSNDTGRPLSYALETSFRITWRGILDFLKCPRMLWFGYREALDHAASRIPENMTAGYVFPGDKFFILITEMPCMNNI